MNEKISVIVPVYNMEKFLVRSLNSLMAQTHRELDILLIDDGSTDGSADICKQYARNDDRFHYYCKENGGVSSARNFGLNISTAKYIAFLDPDDYIDPDMYASLMKAIDETGAEVSFCDFRTVSDEDSPNCGDMKYSVELIDGNEAQWRYFKSTQDALRMTVVWNKLFSASIFEDVRFPEGRIQEDESTWYKLLYNINKIAYVDTPYYNYYIRSDSFMNKKFNRSRFDLFRAYIERMDFYSAKGENELCLQMLFRYIHMLCQYRVWMADADENLSDIYKECLNNIIAERGRLDNIFEMTWRQRCECDLFCKSPSLYYAVWKMMKIFKRR